MSYIIINMKKQINNLDKQNNLLDDNFNDNLDKNSQSIISLSIIKIIVYGIISPSIISLGLSTSRYKYV